MPIFKKYNIILDLDNTLINSLNFQELKHERESQQRVDKKNKRLISKLFQYYDMGRTYRVFLRPHLQKFLDFLFKYFNVSIWTAASKEYALFIIDKIILQNRSERKLDLILFSYHCDYSKRYLNCTKSPVMLWDIFSKYSPSTTYLIDDLSEISKAYPKHVIKADYFDVLKDNSEKDDFLIRTMDRLKKLTKEDYTKEH